MTNKSTDKSNAEVARQLVHEYIEHDLDETLHSDYAGSLAPESLQERIKSALTTAQSQLAETVLAEIAQWEPFYQNIGEQRLHCGATEDATLCAGKLAATGEIHKSVGDLFTRLGIEIGEE